MRITTVSMSFRLLLRGQLNYMSQFFKTHAVSAPGWELDKVEEEENSEVHAVEMKRAPAPVVDLLSLRKLTSLMRKIQPEIVHTHTPKAGLLGMMAARFAGVPIRLHTVAGIPWMEAHGSKRKLLQAMEKLTYRFATHVYSNSCALKDFILENRLLAEAKISVIGNGSSNGIDTQHYSRTPDVLMEAEALKEKFGISHEKIILFVGRLVKDKGIEELLKSYERLKSEHSIKLLLVGPFEPDRDPLSDWAKGFITSDKNIISTGYVDDVRPYMAMSTLLAFPSYREGFPNVPMQAGAMGLPAVVTDINGCNEIVEHEKNGLIVPAKSEVELYNALSRLLKDQNLYQKQANSARPMIASRFEQKVIWEGLYEEYKKNLSKAGIDV